MLFSGIRSLDVALASITSILAGLDAYHLFVIRQYQTLDGLERLLPEVAILIVAMVGVRWLVGHFTETLDRISERHDKREHEFIQALAAQRELHSKMMSEYAGARDAAVRGLHGRFDNVTDILNRQTELMEKMTDRE